MAELHSIVNGLQWNTNLVNVGAAFFLSLLNQRGVWETFREGLRLKAILRGRGKFVEGGIRFSYEATGRNLQTKPPL